MGARVAKGAGEMGGWDVQNNLIFHLVHMKPGLQEGLGVRWSWISSTQLRTIRSYRSQQMWKSECSGGVQWIAGSSGAPALGSPHGRQETSGAYRTPRTELGEGLKEALIQAHGRPDILRNKQKKKWPLFRRGCK